MITYWGIQWVTHTSMLEIQAHINEALTRLDEYFGNKNLVLTLLIDDVKAVPYVRKGDFKGFERLSYETNKFRNRLLEMGHESDAENTSILKEIESKLNYEQNGWNQ